MRRRLTVLLVWFALTSLSCEGLLVGAGAPPSGTVTRSQADGQADGFTSVLGVRFSGILPSESPRLARAIVGESRRAGFSPDLVLAVIQVESGGYNFAVSDAGAMGLMQLRPSTAEAVARGTGLRWRGPDTLFDPAANVRLGVRYLNELVQRYGSIGTALAAYNWGPARIATRLRRGQPIPVGYTRRVMAACEGTSAPPERRI